MGRHGSDRVTTFVGACSELKAALTEMDDDKATSELLKPQCYYVISRTNVPHGSHMGGFWGRLITSVRNVITPLLDAHSQHIDDELLNTLIIETEAFVNSRPITYIDNSCSESGVPLSTIQILTLKSKVIMPPSGVFVKEDTYCRKRWCMVHRLVDQYWQQWKIECLTCLQDDRNGTCQTQTPKVGDIVLLKDENAERFSWPLVQIDKSSPSEEGIVRKVPVLDVHKLELVYSPGSPDEETWRN